MLSAAVVLAVVAGILAMVSLIPQASSYPILNLCVILLAVAVFLQGRG